MSLIRNITERKQTEERLRQQEEELRPWRLDLKLAGGNLEVRGLGIDSRWTTDLRIGGTADSPRFREVYDGAWLSLPDGMSVGAVASVRALANDNGARCINCGSIHRIAVEVVN